MRRVLIGAGVAVAAVVLVTALIAVLRYIRRPFAQVQSPSGPAARTTLPAETARPSHDLTEVASVGRSDVATQARFPLSAGPRLSVVTLAIAPAALLAGGLAFIIAGAPWFLARQHFPSPPEQPIYFSHEIHIEQAGLDCAFCHRTADQVATAGYPDVQQCMFCHIVVEDISQATQRAAYEGQIARLRSAWAGQEPIGWTRVHRLPDHSRFPHDAHVQAGVPCSTCHGEVEQMDLVNQVRSLKMSDCVDCHQETDAPTDCVDCHY